MSCVFPDPIAVDGITSTRNPVGVIAPHVRPHFGEWRYRPNLTVDENAWLHTGRLVATTGENLENPHAN